MADLVRRPRARARGIYTPGVMATSLRDPSTPGATIGVLGGEPAQT